MKLKKRLAHGTIVLGAAAWMGMGALMAGSAYVAVFEKIAGKRIFS